MDKTTSDIERAVVASIETYSWWDEVPDHLKTQEQLKQKGLVATGEIKARVIYGEGRRARSYDLYDQGETRLQPRKQPTSKQQTHQEHLRAMQGELSRTCRSCHQVMERASMLGANGVCVRCK